MTNATSTQLQELYVAYFGRAADPTGLDYWVEKGITTAAFAADMYAAPEFKSVYGSLTTEAQVNQIYKNLFDRAADVTGLTYWTKEINLGNLKLAEIATHLIWAAQNNEGSSDDKTALSNRSSAAVAYTAEVRLTTDGILSYAPLYDGKGTKEFSAGDNINAAKTYMAGIDKDTAHTAAGITSSVNTLKSNGVPADSSTTNVALTTGTDFKTLTASNDTINASGATLGSDDVITDIGGTDTLKVSVSATGATSTILNSTGVEVVQVTNTGAGDQTFELTNASGITSVNSYLSTGAVLFKDAQANAKVVLDGSTGAVTADFANPVVVGSADVANIEIKNDATASVINIGDADDEFETINIAVGTGKNTITDIKDGAGSALGETSKVVITGSGQLTLGEVVLKDASEIDGSAATGKLIITHAETVDKLTGGSGDDAFTLTPADFGSSKAAKTIDGGAGTDTVEFAADVAASTFTAKDSGTHSISAETVKYSDSAIVAAGTASLTPSLDVAGITGVSKVTGKISNSDTTGDHTITFEVTGLPAAGTVDVSSTQDSSVAGQGLNIVQMSLENASGTADALTFDADGIVSDLQMVATADDTSTVGITETGDIETLTISSSDTTTAGVAKTLTLSQITSDDLTKINIVGSNAITISALDLVGASANDAKVSAADQATNVIEFDASTSTGAVSITTTEASNLKITGGSGKLDVDLGSTGPTSSTTITDVIAGGSGTTDTVTIHDSATAGTTYYPNLTGVETLQVETITLGAKIVSLKNTTGVATVEIVDETTGGGFGTTISDINGQVIEVPTQPDTDGGGAEVATDYSSAAIVLNTATGVTNTSVKFTNELASKLNDGAALDGAVFSTNSGAFTIEDASLDNNATSGKDDYENHAYTVAGTAATAELTSLTISGGGDTDTTTAKIDANTHTVTASTHVNIGTVDATGMTANLNLVATALKSGATVSLGTADTTTTVDGLDLVADEVKFTDAGGADVLAATAIGVTNETAIRVNSTGIETFEFGIEEETNTNEAAMTIDMRDAVGASTLELTVQSDTNGTDLGVRSEAVTVSNLASNSKLILTGTDTDGTTISGTTTVDAAITGSTSVTLSNKGTGTLLTVSDLDLGTTYTTFTVEQEADKNITITDLSGTKVTTLNVGAANSVSGTAIASATIDIPTASVDAATTLSIDSNGGPIKIGTTALAAKKLATLDIVGDNAVTFGAAASSVTTALADVNASTATGAITFGSSVDFAATSDIALGTANDTISLVVTTNTNTTLDMGEKTSDDDTLNLTGSVNLGVTNIDLSKADQITQINGVADSAVQAGIESIDLSGLSGTYGAVVTGDDVKNTITGTPNGDVITANGGVDTINGKAGADTINVADTTADTTAAIDTIQIAETEIGDVITGFDVTKDILDLSMAFNTNAAGAALSMAAFGTSGADSLTATNSFNTLDDLTLSGSTGLSGTASVILEIPHASGTISAITTDAFRAKFGAGKTDITVAGNSKGKFAFIAYDGSGTDADAGIFLVDYAGANGASAVIEAGDSVSLIAQIVDVGANNMAAANFA